MSPLIPKPRKPWKDDPGHIHDAPDPPPMPDEQGDLGVPGVSAPGQPRVTHVEPPLEAEEAARGPAPIPDPEDLEVPRALTQEIRRAMKKYPEKRSASIPALWAVQRRYGYCSPEGIEQAAAVMGVTPAYLESVATFYDLFHLEPQGKHEVLVCTNISCWLRGADDLLGAFLEAAGCERPGVTSPDGTAMVRGFECLGACDLAPMVSIDGQYFGPLEDADAAEALEQLRSREDLLPEKRLADRGAAGGMRNPADERITSHPLNKPKRPRPKS